MQQPDIPARLQALPDDVLTYLKENICAAELPLAAARHWINAELSRRHNALRVETPIRVAPPKGTVSIPPAKSVIAAATASGPLPERTHKPKPASAAPAQAVPERPARPAATVPLVGQLALPGTAPKKRDSAVWLWVLIVVTVLVIISVLIGAAYLIQTLPSL